MSVGLQVDFENQGEKTVVRLSGRLDATTSPALEAKAQEILGKQGTKILLDFARVDYLSSAGMRFLLSATKKVKTAGGVLALCSLSDDVMEIIKMAGFERILHIFPTENEALSNM